MIIFSTSAIKYLKTCGSVSSPLKLAASGYVMTDGSSIVGISAQYYFQCYKYFLLAKSACKLYVWKPFKKKNCKFTNSRLPSILDIFPTKELYFSHSTVTTGTDETIHYEIWSLQTWIFIYLINVLKCELCHTRTRKRNIL